MALVQLLLLIIISQPLGQKYQGAYRSEFVLRTLAYHFNAMAGAVDIPALSKNRGILGALALAATGVCLSSIKHI